MYSSLYFFLSCTGTKCTKRCRSCSTAHVREATVLLHGHDPIRYQQSEGQEDDAERDLHVDRGPLPLLQSGGQTRMEGTLELKNKCIIRTVEQTTNKSLWVSLTETVHDILLLIYNCRIPSAITSRCTTCSFVRRHQMVKFLSGLSDLRPIDASLWIRCTRWVQLTAYRSVTLFTCFHLYNEGSPETDFCLYIWSSLSTLLLLLSKT